VPSLIKAPAGRVGVADPAPQDGFLFLGRARLRASFAADCLRRRRRRHRLLIAVHEVITSMATSTTRGCTGRGVVGRARDLELEHHVSLRSSSASDAMSDIRAGSQP